MVITVGDVWRPYAKSVVYSINGDRHGALILRKKGVHRMSENVIAINKKFAEVAKACAESVRNVPAGEQRAKAFQRCIAQRMSK